jgi:hypothetical protein
MFRLFRKIRNDELFDRVTRKYLAYSTGELVLVVIGILFALQINNWNEDRIEQQEIAEFSHALIQDLESDVVMVEAISAQMEYLLTKIDGLAEYIQGKSIEEIRNIDLFYFMRVPYYRPYAWNRAALEQIVSSGALRQMDNNLLAEKISAYDAATRHMDEDFAHDRRNGINASELANQVVNMNYPKLDEILVFDPKGYFIPQSALLNAYENADLSLLTNDIEKIGVAVNSYLHLGGRMGIGSRVNVEMPRLLEEIAELIELLKTEYPK